MSKKNGLFGFVLYIFFFSCLMLLIPACNVIFPPKILNLTVYPRSEGYLAMINVSEAKPALLIQDTELKNFDQFLADLKTEGNDPQILILGTLNAGMMEKIKSSGVLDTIKEFHFPEMNERPAYLESAVKELKAKKVLTGPLRQSRYLPLRHAELIVLAPHEYDVYDEKSRIAFKLIRGRKSIILAPMIDNPLYKTLTRSFGKGALRSDVVFGVGISGVAENLVNELFNHPEIILTDIMEPKVPVRFRTDGNMLERL